MPKVKATITFVDEIVSSRSASHDDASEAVSVPAVASSTLERMFEEISSGFPARGRCDGTSNAISLSRPINWKSEQKTKAE